MTTRYPPETHMLERGEASMIRAWEDDGQPFGAASSCQRIFDTLGSWLSTDVCPSPRYCLFSYALMSSFRATLKEENTKARHINVMIARWQPQRQSNV
jgi:hypothetical protein